jgi:hypothetical protein
MVVRGSAVRWAGQVPAAPGAPTRCHRHRQSLAPAAANVCRELACIHSAFVVRTALSHAQTAARAYVSTACQAGLQPSTAAPPQGSAGAASAPHWLPQGPPVPARVAEATTNVVTRARAITSTARHVQASCSVLQALMWRLSSVLSDLGDTRVASRGGNGTLAPRALGVVDTGSASGSDVVPAVSTLAPADLLVAAAAVLRLAPSPLALCLHEE